jgi:hypothetical protein
VDEFKRMCAGLQAVVEGASSSWEIMKPFPVGVYVSDAGDSVFGAAMDLDLDGDALELFQGVDSCQADQKPLDADFFNCFEDDFDDTDVS